MVGIVRVLVRIVGWMGRIEAMARTMSMLSREGGLLGPSSLDSTTNSVPGEVSNASLVG